MNYLKLFCVGDVSVLHHLFNDVSIQSFIYINIDLHIFILYFGLSSKITLFCCNFIAQILLAVAIRFSFICF